MKKAETLVKVRDRVKKLLKESGAVTMGNAMSVSGDSWTSMACVDRLVELKELREIPQSDVPGQCRVFVPIDR